MGFIKRAFIGIIRRPFRSISLAIILVITSAVSFIGSFLDSIIDNYEALINEEAGYTITLISAQTQEDIPEEFIEEILSCGYILGASCEYRILAEPVDFENHVPESGSDFDMPQKDEIRLCGVSDVSLAHYFMLGNFSLVLGEYPEQGTDGVLIEENFAEYNGLTIGDGLSIWNEDGTWAVELTVCGIYTVNEETEEVIEAGGEYIYGASPYSWIFCSWDTVCEVSSEPLYKYICSFYCESRSMLDKAYAYIENLGYDTGIYSFQNEMEAYFNGNSAVMGTLKSLADVLIRIVRIMLYLICGLMVIFWMKSHNRQVWIYISLGAGRIRVLIDCIAEGMAVTLLSFAFSDAVVFTVLRKHGGFIIEKLLEFSAAGQEVEGLGMQALETVMEVKDMVSANIMVFVIVIFSILISAGFVLFHKGYRAK